MGRLIEQQAVIDCLTNTAKYYDMPQADEWTKGIHYGLLHGIDNILDNVKPVEAIPITEMRKMLRDCANKVSDSILDIVKEEYILKADYENRLKADMVAMLKDIQLDIEEQKFDTHIDKDVWNDAIRVCSELIQQKINELKGDNNEQKQKA